jgi:hypothetical protein
MGVPTFSHASIPAINWLCADKPDAVAAAILEAATDAGLHVATCRA